MDVPANERRGADGAVTLARASAANQANEVWAEGDLSLPTKTKLVGRKVLLEFAVTC